MGKPGQVIEKPGQVIEKPGQVIEKPGQVIYLHRIMQSRYIAGLIVVLLSE